MLAWRLEIQEWLLGLSDTSWTTRDQDDSERLVRRDGKMPRDLAAAGQGRAGVLEDEGSRTPGIGLLEAHLRAYGR